MKSPALRWVSKSLWSYNPIPTGCVLFLPLWHPDLKGTPFKSIDLFGHSATVTGTTWGSQGRTFDGTDDFINMGDSTVFDLTTSLTLGCWFYITDLTDERHFISRDDTTNRNWVSYVDANGRPLFIVWVGDVAKVANGTNGDVVINTWYSYFATYDGVTVQVYLNGSVLPTSVATAGPIDNDDVRLEIGSRDAIGGGDKDMKGIIGEVGMWSRSLSAGEILYYHSITQGRY